MSWRAGDFERHYSGWDIQGTADGYTARRKVNGRPKGRRLAAPTLDELGAAIDEHEAASGGGLPVTPGREPSGQPRSEQDDR